jgi:hypothetical protein
MPDKTLITIKALKNTSGLSFSTLRRLVRGRKIPFFQPSGKGGKLLFPPDAVECAALDAPSPNVSPRLAGRQPSWMKGSN